MTKPKGRAFWERVVREVEVGATQASVAARYDVNVSTVGYWVRRLGARSVDVPSSAALAASPTLLPVRVKGGERRCFGVIFPALRVEFEEGTDASYVAAVVRALAAC